MSKVSELYAQYKQSPFSFLLRQKDEIIKSVKDDIKLMFDVKELSKHVESELKIQKEEAKLELREDMHDYMKKELGNLPKLLSESQMNTLAHKILELAKPKKGWDYFNRSDKAEIINEVLSELVVPAPRNGIDGHTPVAGVDYPSYGETESMILELLEKHSEDKVESEKSLMEKCLGLLLENPEKIARALETLRDSERLDYLALKNRPDTTKVDTKSPSGRIGGGGDIIYMKDLSLQTDGVSKTFAVPYSRRSIMVVCSDFPSVLFENNGYTLNAARTLLTLSVDNAPSQGSQLGHQYVV